MDVAPEIIIIIIIPATGKQQHPFVNSVLPVVCPSLGRLLVQLNGPACLLKRSCSSGLLPYACLKSLCVLNVFKIFVLICHLNY